MKAKCLCGDVSFRSGTRQTRPRLSLPDVPHLGQRRDVFADCRQTAENRRRGEHRPLPFVRMGGTCVLQKLRYTPVLPLPAERQLFRLRRTVCRQRRFQIGRADFHRRQSPVLRTGKRHAQADRRRIFGTIRQRIGNPIQRSSENLAATE